MLATFYEPLIVIARNRYPSLRFMIRSSKIHPNVQQSHSMWSAQCQRNRNADGHLLLCSVDVVNQDIGVKEYPFHRSMMCAKCSSCAISSTVMFTMPRRRLNSAGTSLLGAGSSIDSVMNVTTICFCSRVMPFSNAVYGAIGVSLILCANVVIIEASLVSGGKNTKIIWNIKEINKNHRSGDSVAHRIKIKRPAHLSIVERLGGFW